MEIGNQIRKHRMRRQLSQEQLAEKIYVSRQTISNWERGKNYPDLDSLLMLSSLFDMSLDELVKGDVEEMEKEIQSRNIRTLECWSIVLAILFVLMLVTPVALAHVLKWTGLLIWGVIAVVTLFAACKVEQLKKQNEIKTYKEITAFMNGKRLDRQQRIIEQAKWPYQKVLLVLGSAGIALLCCTLAAVLLSFFS